MLSQQKVESMDKRKLKAHGVGEMRGRREIRWMGNIDMFNQNASYILWNSQIIKGKYN